MKKERFFNIVHWASFCSVGLFVCWAMIIYFSHWDEVMTSKTQFMLQWKPLLGIFLSFACQIASSILLNREK